MKGTVAHEAQPRHTTSTSVRAHCVTWGGGGKGKKGGRKEGVEESNVRVGLQVFGLG